MGVEIFQHFVGIPISTPTGCIRTKIFLNKKIY